MKDALGHGSAAHQTGVETALSVQRPADPAKVNSFVAGAQNIINQDHAQNYPSLTPPSLEVRNPDAPRYLAVDRVERTPNGAINSRSVHSFIDRSTGDVLKPAGWKTPAKGVRGNIHDENNGLGRMGPHGPAYNNHWGKVS